MSKSWMSGVCLTWLAASCGAVKDVQGSSTQLGGQHPAPATADDDSDDDSDDDEQDENDQELALDQVPAAIKQAAEAAVPGFVLVSAETETEKGARHYCLVGTAGGESVEIELGTDGKVLEIERGEADEDD
ncbi:MAG: hypothetical protein HOP15_09045 [Planctomycetes bacterium]|nr:hypothetical protein [Planctomycetota bacterium]